MQDVVASRVEAVFAINWLSLRFGSYSLVKASIKQAHGLWSLDCIIDNCFEDFFFLSRRHTKIPQSGPLRQLDELGNHVSPRGHSQSSLLSSLRQRSVAVMNSRYLLSMSSKMCFLSRLMASGTYSWLFRSASSLEHTHAGIYLVVIYIFQLVRNLWNQQEILAHKTSLDSF